jgi:hypothetical protein
VGIRHCDRAGSVGKGDDAAELLSGPAQPGGLCLDLGVDQLVRAWRPGLELPHEGISRRVQLRHRVAVHEQVS